MAATETVTLLALAPLAVPQLIGTRSYLHWKNSKDSASNCACLDPLGSVLTRINNPICCHTSQASKATIPGAGTGAETAP